MRVRNFKPGELDINGSDQVLPTPANMSAVVKRLDTLIDAYNDLQEKSRQAGCVNKKQDDDEDGRDLSIDIYSPPGTKVGFLGRNGMPGELKHAKNVLKRYKVYTISRIDVGDWNSEVFLEEVPGESFNSVMFGAVEEK